MPRLRQNYYFNGCKPSKLLALKLKQSESRAAIKSIHMDWGISTNSKDINATFQSFYSKLYESSCNPDPTQCHEFLKELILPLLDPEEAEELGQPITLEEFKSALKTGKTPGLDGIPSELLLQYFDILGPIILQSLTSGIEMGTFQQQANTALISVIPKKLRSAQTTGPSASLRLILSSIP